MLRHRLHQRREGRTSRGDYTVSRMGTTGMISVIGVTAGQQMEPRARWGATGAKSRWPPRWSNRARLGLGFGHSVSCLPAHQSDWVG